MPRSLLFPALLLALALASAAGQEAPRLLNSDDVPRGAPRAFERADADHNGLLDAREFAAYTSALKQALGPFLGPDDSEDRQPRAVFHGAAEAEDRAEDRAEEQAPLGRQGDKRLRAGGVNKFWSGFMSGILTIWATEIGDKTFFIAAILSMKKDRVVVFAGAIGALIVMTVLSVVMGVVATKFLPPSLTHYLGAVLFVVFGVKMLYDAREMSAR